MKKQKIKLRTYAQRKFKVLEKYETLKNYAYLKLVRINGKKLN
jgi:hypothetical protein|tara:strand:+ start:1115 stop:1243 length:129 start_codon:yes stop_codon:yes gene_type:complete